MSTVPSYLQADSECWKTTGYKTVPPYPMFPVMNQSDNLRTDPCAYQLDVSQTTAPMRYYTSNLLCAPNPNLPCADIGFTPVGFFGSSVTMGCCNGPDARYGNVDANSGLRAVPTQLNEIKPTYTFPTSTTPYLGRGDGFKQKVVIESDLLYAQGPLKQRAACNFSTQTYGNNQFYYLPSNPQTDHPTQSVCEEIGIPTRNYRMPLSSNPRYQTQQQCMQ